ncbi:Rad2 nuclease [Apophysomyces ossiformis]|uniref:Rad2 nuclease n=1 Tax=Apophysomyces ossiformis TaxID=679940 RepID=A0A8H7BS41_9FUNG|nr:Rad2 nuclease [Apophysomyces ossiformis]
MGISGLFQLTKSIQQSIHVKEYGGRVVAVDGNVWLHKGAFACALDLALQVDTTTYVKYFMRQVDMLKFYNVIPLIVFDGNQLPIKKCTNQERQRRRAEALAKGHELIRQGKRKEAAEYFQKATSVTPHMVHQVAKALDEAGVQHIVAPYEADAQLAYLLKTKQAEAVITEDSDLLVFGCHTLIVKMNQYGEATQIRQEDLRSVKEIDLSNFDETKIRHMCIVSGCDYLPSLPGIGLKTAYKLFKQYEKTDKVLKQLGSQGNMISFQDYEDAFHRADLAFLYQYVYDPLSKTYLRLNSLPDDKLAESLDFLGTHPEKSKPKAGIDLSSDNKENIPPWLLAVTDNKKERENKSKDESLTSSDSKILNDRSNQAPANSEPRSTKKGAAAADIFKMFHAAKRATTSVKKPGKPTENVTKDITTLEKTSTLQPTRVSVDKDLRKSVSKRASLSDATNAACKKPKRVSGLVDATNRK